MGHNDAVSDLSKIAVPIILQIRHYATICAFHLHPSQPFGDEKIWHTRRDAFSFQARARRSAAGLAIGDGKDAHAPVSLSKPLNKLALLNVLRTTARRRGNIFLPGGSRSFWAARHLVIASCL